MNATVLERTFISSTKASNSSSNPLNSSISAPTAVINNPDTLWLLVSSVLVFIMIPGLALFYSGFVRRINTLSIFTALSVASSVVILQWFLFGYSLVFSENGSFFIGALDYVILNKIDGTPSLVATTVPSNIFMMFQSLFAAITPCLFFGAIAERATITSFVIISFFWTTFVYDFIAYWTWNKNGWLNNLGALDFAGGGPVHMASGFSALAFALAVGPRTSVDTKKTKPINLTEIFIGTALLWFGWFGFNGGSESAINARAVNAVVTSNFAACTGGISWVLIEMAFHRTRKVSLNAFCSGAIASLVSITPACGFVNYPSSILIGALTSICCFSAGFIKKFASKRFDDTCDVFAVHGVGGIVGSILTGVFAKNSVVMLADQPISGGAIDGNFMQVAYQAASVGATAVWSFTITFILVKLYDLIPGLKLRLDDEEEFIGADLVELGEQAYGVEPNIEKNLPKTNPTINSQLNKPSKDNSDLINNKLIISIHGKEDIPMQKW